MPRSEYLATIHDSPKEAYLERLRHAEEKLAIFAIGTVHVVAISEHAAKMKFADSFECKKLLNDDLKNLNRDLLIGLTDAKK